MNYKKSSVQFLKLPLVIAIGSTILAGCNNTAPIQGTTPNTQQIPVAHNEAVSNVPATDSGYSNSLLDDESLDELENLLEATDMKMVEDDRLAIEKYGNLWDRMRAGFAMDQSGYTYNQRIEAQKNWFVTRQDYINRLTARASRYLYHTVREAERRNIPTELALLPVIESSYDPTANSNASAAGLWQFIPSTGRIYGLTQTPTYDGRRDVIESTRAAYDFLTSLYNQFGSWELALAAYNAGPGRVQKAIDYNRERGLPTDFWSLTLPTETMNYVPRFLAVSQIIADTDRYSIYLPAIANRQHFRSVPANYGVSLQEVSQLTGVDYDELRMLNPSLISGRVDTAGPNRVIIPNQVNITADSKISVLKGNGNGSGPYSISDPQYEVLSKTPEGLAEFASIARAPIQNTSYIEPLASSATTQFIEPPINQAEKNEIETEFASANTLPTTSAQVTRNDTIIQEPPLTPEEKQFISQQIRQQSPEVGEVVSSVDGNIKLEAIQTQQSILNARGQDKKLSFDKPSNKSQLSSPAKPSGQRTVYTVQRGDTLVNIASRAGLNWRDIADWNQINPNATLLAGTKLYLYDAKPILPLNAQSSSAGSNQNSGQPNIYTVQPGDTLIGTANRVGLSVSKLASYNGLTPNSELRIGQKLWLIPGKGNTNSSTSASSSVSSTYKGKTQSYTVKRGDSLIGLASRYNVSLGTLASMNDMSTNEQLLIGQRLTVPASSSTPTAASKSNNTSNSTSTSSNNYRGETSNYKVKSGETLIGIANKLKVPHTQIAQINGFPANTQLQRGQSIKLPVSSDQVTRVLNNQAIKYKVKSGDTLIGVANKFNASISDIASANNMSTNSQLLRGSTLVIPSANGSSSSKTVNQTSTKSSGSSSSNRNAPSSYKVESGDSLIGLAGKFGVSVSDLASANNISTTSNVFIGQVLKIPTGNESNSSSNVSSKSNTSSRVSNTVSYSGIYKVKSGDSLIGLANKFGVSLSDLASANALKTNSGLIIGQTIKVPTGSTGSGSSSSNYSTASNKSVPKSVNAISVNTSGNYTVKSGDSLIGLAKKHGVSVSKLASANGLSNNAQLKIGQKITIPATTTTYKVKSGDSLIGLAKKYGMTPEEFAKLNGLASNALLQRGQTLKVPIE